MLRVSHKGRKAGQAMGNWSDAMKFTDIDAFRDELSGYSGAYEIGFVRSGLFYPKYIGKAKCLWDRLTTYRNKSECHNDNILELIFDRTRQNLYFHVVKTRDYAATESRLLHRFDIKKGRGVYEFNQKKERYHLDETYDRQVELAAPDVATSCGHCRVSCRRRVPGGSGE